MDIYANQLLKEIRSVLGPNDEISDFLPADIRLKPKWSRYWDQYVKYQFSCRTQNADINHIVDAGFSHLIFSLPAKKTIITFHDAIGFRGKNGMPCHLARYNELRCIQRYNIAALHKAAAILCDSESTRKLLIDFPGIDPGKIEVIYSGVDDSFFKQSNQYPNKLLGIPRGKYIVHVGHTQFYKNIPALFHVLSILKRSLGKDVKLLKVGTDFTSDQDQLAHQLGVSDSIIHLGMLEDSLMPHVYRSADVLLFPSLDEGFGLPVLEAMASGLPVIASNRGSIPEVAGNTSILLDPDDYGAMAKHIVAILDNPSLRGKLSSEGVNRAKLFTWKKTAERTREVYRRVYREQCQK